MEHCSRPNSGRMGEEDGDNAGPAPATVCSKCPIRDLHSVCEEIKEHY